MTRRLLPGPVSAVHGTAEVPTSKSLTNRALIAAAAADGGRIRRPLDCEDTRLLARALAAAGWTVTWDGDIVVGPRRADGPAALDLGNSGTGARLIVGLLACVEGKYRVDGSPRLRERPMGPLIESLASLGSEIRHRDGFLPIEITGCRLAGGAVTIRPEVSSQFVSSLLLAGPLMTDGLDLEVEGELPSRPYLDLTLQTLDDFGVTVATVAENRWRVAPGGYRRTEVAVESDWSAAAFPAAAVAVAGGRVLIPHLTPSSRQGDRALADILTHAGLQVDVDAAGMTVAGLAVSRFEADLRDTPDLFPALAVVAAAAPAGSTLTGLEHLRHKESDRWAVMIANLEKLGAEFDADRSRVEVTRGLQRHRDSPVEATSADDHRIAMAMAVAALATGPIVLDAGDCVAKSFPGFWSVWERLLATPPPPP